MGSALAPVLAALSLACAVATLPALAQKSRKLELGVRIERARETATVLGERLRAELGTQIRNSGVVSAIGLCQTISPDLTTNAADEFGFEAIRTALRLRNPENAPDDWERKVLELFQTKLAAGADPARLEHHEIVVTAEGEKLFRYMKPIITGEMCLACHGSDLKPEVKAEITRYYPDDKATNFKVGELRGAFSLAQLIEE